MLESLYLDAERYDQISSHTHDHLFWIAQALGCDSVLELACGTGRVAIPLAEAGYNVTGIDNSQTMLDAGKRKAKKAGVKVNFMQGDMRHFSTGETYGLIFIAYNSFIHMLTDDDAKNCLASIRKHLAPGGRFIMELFIPPASTLAEDGQFYHYHDYKDAKRGEIVSMMQACQYDTATKILHLRWQYIGKKSGFMSEETFNMRMYFPDDLDALLKEAGFTIAARYGDFDGSEFGVESTKQIIICEAAD